MRENRPYGSEGGEGQTLPDPYHHEGGVLFASLIPRRRHERLELLLDQSGKADAGAVVILRPDDLDADRQALLGESDRRDRRGQVDEAGIAGPEQLVGGRDHLAVHLDGALVALAGVIVRAGGG